MNGVRRFGRLRLEEKRWLAVAAVALPVVGLLIRVLAFRGVDRILRGVAGRPRNRSRNAHNGSTAARRIARMVGIASRHGPYRPSCLVRALVLRTLLDRAGIPCELRFGACKDETAAGGLHAHCWIESGGVVLGEPDGGHERFVPFERVTPDRAVEVIGNRRAGRCAV